MAVCLEYIITRPKRQTSCSWDQLFICIINTLSVKFHDYFRAYLFLLLPHLLVPHPVYRIYQQNLFLTFDRTNQKVSQHLLLSPLLPLLKPSPLSSYLCISMANFHIIFFVCFVFTKKQSNMYTKLNRLHPPFPFSLPCPETALKGPHMLHFFLVKHNIVTMSSVGLGD